MDQTCDESHVKRPHGATRGLRAKGWAYLHYIMLISTAGGINGTLFSVCICKTQRILGKEDKFFTPEFSPT